MTTDTKSSFMRAIMTKFDKAGFTIFGIHVVELGETAIMHADKWGSLHTAMAVGLTASVIGYFRKS